MLPHWSGGLDSLPEGDDVPVDSKTFDTLTRDFGSQRSRRAALQGLAAALFGLGFARSASAQVSAELATCGQSCSGSEDCNAGLRCSRPAGFSGICVAIADSRVSCNRNINCQRNFELCRNGRCVNQSTCDRCNIAEDCPSGQACRRGNCGECNRDRDCRSNEVCRNGKCKRSRNRCDRNRDCPRNKRCRNGRCRKR
jgi:hypothetical protein